MRRMISFSPVAYGEISEHLDDFILDNPLQLNATYYIVFDDGSGKHYSTFLTTDANPNSFNYAGWTTFEGEVGIMTWHNDMPQHLSLNIEVEEEGALIKVMRIA